MATATEASTPQDEPVRPVLSLRCSRVTSPMTTWDERFRPGHRAEHLLERVAVLFRVQGPSHRPLRCARYRVATGLELRFEYEDRDDLQRSHLFRVRDDNAIATMADEWQRALRAKRVRGVAMRPSQRSALPVVVVTSVNEAFALRCLVDMRLRPLSQFT
jgi:hypothetical protein